MQKCTKKPKLPNTPLRTAPMCASVICKNENKNDYIFVHENQN